MTKLIAILAFAILCAAYVALYTSGRWQHRVQYRWVRQGRSGRRRWWILRAWVLFGLTSIIAILILGGADAFFDVPVQFDPIRGSLLDGFGGPGAFSRLFGSLMQGLFGGFILLAILELIQRLRGKPPAHWKGEIEARSLNEVPPVLLMAVTAGVTEELFFRLALPLAIISLFGHPWIAFAISILLFAVLHRYQGIGGLLLTPISALMFTIVYLGSGSLLMAIALHSVIDIYGMIVRPLVGGRLRLSFSGDSRF